MRKLRLILITAVATLTLAACNRVPYEPIIGIYDDNFEYKHVVGGIEIVAYIGTSERVHIPDRISNRPVIAISPMAFLEAGIVEIHVPYSVRNIGRSAFCGNPNLTNVTLENNAIRMGGLIYFNNIFWRVLDIQDGRAKIISDAILFELYYHEEDMDITWEYSGIRAYLNGQFLDTFSPEDRQRIVLTNVVNNENYFGIDGGNDTADYVFLLSIDEAYALFADNDSRIAFLTHGRGSERTWIEWWWLRSLGFEPDHAANVSHVGDVNYWGDDVYYHVGIRPVMWIEIDR